MSSCFLNDLSQILIFAGLLTVRYFSPSCSSSFALAEPSLRDPEKKYDYVLESPNIILFSSLHECYCVYFASEDMECPGINCQSQTKPDCREEKLIPRKHEQRSS